MIEARRVMETVQYVQKYFTVKKFEDNWGESVPIGKGSYQRVTEMTKIDIKDPLATLFCFMGASSDLRNTTHVSIEALDCIKQLAARERATRYTEGFFEETILPFCLWAESLSVNA